MLPICRQVEAQACSPNAPSPILAVNQFLLLEVSSKQPFVCLFVSARGKARGPGCKKVTHIQQEGLGPLCQ